jgi:TonB-dependent receptor
MGNHLFDKTEVNWRASYSTMREEIPWMSTIIFEEYSAFVEDTPINNINPKMVPTYAKNDDQTAWMTWNDIQEQKVDGKNVTAQLDIRYPFQLSNNFSGYFKAGVKARSTKREKDVSQWGGNRWAVAQDVNTNYDEMFVNVKGRAEDIALTNFIFKDKKSYDDFLKGEYEFNEILDMDKLHWFAETFEYIYRKTPRAEVDAKDYTGNENIYAAYFMAEFNWRRLITFMPGIRYERTKTDYSTSILNPTQSLGGNYFIQPAFNDTLGNRTYENFLPMFQLRIKPLDWFDIRFAFTKSLSRPDFYNLIPYELIDWDSHTLQYGNPSLKECVSTNYDICLSFYNRYGLFTIAPFYKKIKNIDYVRSGIKQGGYYSPYLTNLKGWTVTAPENLKGETIVKGWEFELQTNLKFLPSPFNGILIYANYSTIQSETQYPYTYYSTKFISTPPYVVTTVIDTARTGRMIGQADQIANLTLGYEKGGFLGRISMIYQGDALRSVAQAEENDGLDDEFIRWDLVMQQKIYKGIKFIAQVNNITDQEEKAFIRYKKYPTRRERFGRTVYLGLQFEY